MKKCMLKQTWLVHRLLKPRKGSGDNPFTFGGGLYRGGLSKEAMNLLEPIFSFDYMGAAEFEFGIVPKSLNQLAGAFAVDKGCTGEMKIANVPVYYLCNQLNEEDVKIRIKELSKRGFRLKEPTLFDEVLARLYMKLHPTPDFNGNRPASLGRSDLIDDLIGWFELDNDFMFFTDREAFEKMKMLLERKV